MEFWRRLSKRDKFKYLSAVGGVLGILISAIIYSFIHSAVGAGLFIATVIGSFLPYALFTYFKDKKIEEMENKWPKFLKNLSEGIKSGMPLPEAWRHASDSDYGALNKELEISSKQLSWDIPFTEVLERFQNRVSKTNLISNSISIIIQSYESGGDIAKTIDSVSRNLSQIQTAEKEKKSTVMQQVYIMYAIFFLFVGIVIALYRILQPLLDMGGAGEFMGDAPNFCTDVDLIGPICNLCPLLGFGESTDQLCYYQSLFFLMLVVQGLFSGIVAGEIGSGKLSAGVKHALIMVPSGMFAYILVLTVLGV